MIDERGVLRGVLTSEAARSAAQLKGLGCKALPSVYSHFGETLFLILWRYR
jgi:hypothetical protein